MKHLDFDLLLVRDQGITFGEIEYRARDLRMDWATAMINTVATCDHAGALGEKRTFDAGAADLYAAFPSTSSRQSSVRWNQPVVGGTCAFDGVT